MIHALLSSIHTTNLQLRKQKEKLKNKEKQEKQKKVIKNYYLSYNQIKSLTCS